MSPGAFSIQNLLIVAVGTATALSAGLALAQLRQVSRAQSRGLDVWRPLTLRSTPRAAAGAPPAAGDRVSLAATDALAAELHRQAGVWSGIAAADVTQVVARLRPSVGASGVGPTSRVAPPSQEPPSAPSPAPSISTTPQPTASPATTTTVVAQPPLLLIGIPTVRREGDPDYLQRTLRYLTAEVDAAGAVATDPSCRLPDGRPCQLRVRVLVMNNSRKPARHAVWEKARDEWCADACDVEELESGKGTVWHRKDRPLLTFAHNGVPLVSDGTDEGVPNVPGYRVRQQTRDVSDLLSLASHMAANDRLQTTGSGGAAADAGVAQAYMFMEDDFRMCPRGGAALAYLIHRAHHLRPNWNAIRVSFGLNGAIVRMADVPALEAYYREHVARRPPDHLTVEWFAGERDQSAAVKAGRPHMAFRYNVLEHFGHVSSLRDKETPHYALCYDTLNEGVVFEVEAWKEYPCQHDDLWPCDPAGSEGHVGGPHTDVQFAALSQAARADSVQTWKNPDAQ
jgi:hypothetical protein